MVDLSYEILENEVFEHLRKIEIEYEILYKIKK